MSLAENIIQTLSVEEIKKIEKFLVESNQKQQHSLFQLMTKFSDPDTIELRFKKANPKSNISVVKSQLGQQLLQNTYTEQSENFVFSQVNELVLLITFYIKKSAFDVVKKLFEKAYTLAQENELFSQTIDLLEIKMSLSHTKIFDDIYIVEDEILNFLEKKRNSTIYQILLRKQGDLIAQNFTIKTDELQVKHNEIINHPLLKSPDCALSARATLDFWILKGQYFSIFNDYAKAADSFNSFLIALDKAKALKKQRNLNYLSICAQLVTYGYILKDIELMQSSIDRLQNSETYSEIEKIAAHTFLVNSKVAFYDFTKNKDGLKSTINEAYQLLKIYSPKLKPDVRSSILLTCISGYAEFGEYDLLLDFSREFDSYIQSDTRIDTKVSFYFYELIAQIETGNEILVNDTLQNFNRFLLRHEFKGEFEEIMIKFLKVASANSFKSNEILKKLKDQLTELPQKTIQNQNRVLYQILTNMIESKLAGKKFHEYLDLAKT